MLLQGRGHTDMASRAHRSLSQRPVNPVDVIFFFFSFSSSTMPTQRAVDQVWIIQSNSAEATCSETREEQQKVLRKRNHCFLTGPTSFSGLKGSQRRHKVGKQGGAIACIEGSTGKLTVPPTLWASLLRFDPDTVFLPSNVGDKLLLLSLKRSLQRNWQSSVFCGKSERVRRLSKLRRLFKAQLKYNPTWQTFPESSVVDELPTPLPPSSPQTRS